MPSNIKQNERKETAKAEWGKISRQATVNGYDYLVTSCAPRESSAKAFEYATQQLKLAVSA